MSEKCAECGEITAWEQELGSAICTHCGTLANPSQSVLASHLERTDTSGYEYTQYWNNDLQGRSTLKGRNGWALPGQDKEATKRRNTVQMHEFIRSIVLRLASPGLASRAQNIFDHAMQKGHYRWGHKAKVTAGASIAIALREAHKSDSIRDIAHLLDESPVSVAFTYRPFHGHLLYLIQTPCPDSTLPVDLLKSLRSLVAHFPDVIRTATSLSSLAVRLDRLTNLPTGPTACAILILSLEAELNTSLPNAGALAQALGARMGISKRVVMERYKIIYDAVEEWIKEIPWLETHERRGGGKGRSKVAKRVVVARGLKDVVQFQEEVWQKKMEDMPKPALSLECEREGDDVESDESKTAQNQAHGGASDIIPPPNSASRGTIGTRRPRQMKRQSTYQRAVADTSRFFLNPLSISSPSIPAVDAPGVKKALDQDLLTHLLTVDDVSLERAFEYAPTRLQVLAATRGGTGEGIICDDELFEDGELEGLLRTEDEIQALQDTFGWNIPGTSVDPSPPKSVKKTKRKSSPADLTTNDTGDIRGPPAKRTKRINMDALAKLLDPSVVLDGSEDEDQTPEPDDAFFSRDEEVVGDWRPLSPGGGGFDDYHYDV